MVPRIKKDGLPSRVYLKHGAYYFVDKNHKWHPLGKSLGQMYRKLAELSIDAPAQNTVNHMIQGYLRDVLPKKSPSTIRNYERYFKKYWGPALGHMIAEKVRPMHIAAVHDKIGENHPTEANRAMSAVSRLFAYGLKKGFVDKRPTTGLSRHTESPRNRDISLDEYLAVYVLASPTYQVAMELSRLTGMRQGDILALRWSDTAQDGIFNHASKNNRKLIYRMNDSLAFTLKEARGLLDGAISHYVIPSRKGGRFTSSGFQTGWQRLMRISQAKGIERFTFHDIRALAAGMQDTIKSAAALLGNSEAATSRHYRRKPQIVEPNS